MPGGIVAPLIGAGASIIGGIIGSGAAKRAGQHIEAVDTAAGNAINNTVKAGEGFVSDATSAGQGGIDAAKNQGNQVLSDVWTGQQQNLNPYLQAGQQGTTSLMSALAPGGSLAGTFHAPTADEAAATPGYQFQLDQGNKAVQRSAAAAGGLGSGGTMKALDQYSQGLASTYYQNAYNNALQAFQTNHQNTLQGYMALTGIGQNATGQYNSAAQNYGNLTSANTLNAGQAVANMGLQGSEFNAGYGLQGSKIANDYFTAGAAGGAAGTVGAGNAWQNALNGVAGAGGQIFGGGTPSSSGGGYNPAVYNPSYAPPGQYTPSYVPPLAPPTVGPNPYAPQPLTFSRPSTGYSPGYN